MKKHCSFLLALTTLIVASCGKPVPSVFEVASATEEMRKLYAERLRDWPLPYAERDVATSFGKTHVIEFGKEDGEPLVLLHGTLATSVSWRPNATALGATHRVYAIDYVGDLGLSELSALDAYPADGAAAARWLGEALDGLGIGATRLVGASYGGWIALEFAARNPDRVGKLALLGPAGIAPLSFGMLMRYIEVLSVSPRDPAKVKSFVEWSLGNDAPSIDLVGGFIDLGLTYGNKAATPTELPRGALEAIRCPVLIACGNADPFFGDGTEDAGRVAGLGNFRVEKLEGPHMIGIARAERVNPLLIAFLE